MKIVYMGTPEFAVLPLTALCENGYDVAAVFSQPDKPKGRGYKLAPPPVKEYAVSKGIPVYQPVTLKNDETAEIINSIRPDMIIVVAYGKILPENILKIPPLGCINVHGSLLPKYRGAAPIQHSVLNGDKITGVTTMYMDEGLDTGDMILKSETEIGENETSAELYDRLTAIGAELLIKTIKAIENGTAERIKQDDAAATYACMLSKSMSPIDFKKTALQVHNQIRGLSDWPCASTQFEGKTLKVYSSRLADGFKGSPGEILDDKRFIIGCGDGNAIELLTLQLQGAKRMDAKSFLAGHKIKKGSKLC